MTCLRRLARGIPVLVALSSTLLAGSAALRVSANQPQVDGDLSRSFVEAALAIRRHQDPAGYWETLVTPTAAFEGATTEINVFTPAFIVDLLEPVANDIGLTDVLDRARAYLRSHIEKSGLVRYHGDPGAVEPSQRGCELPPDADDTALVWRIAPKDDPALLRAARDTIARYRVPSGLYLTWLADQRAYRCFYTTFFPRDPNPPDVGIQMHVYLFLARYDAHAAGRLCTALRQRIGDEGIWVWYTLAPLLPLIREADLARAGCPVRVPETRLTRAVPGQEPYIAHGRLFRDVLASAESPALHQRAVRLLSELAAGGFEKVARTPPLLYHNALSAVPPHYHWSAEAGYALWLRLYVEVARRSGGALALPIGPR